MKNVVAFGAIVIRDVVELLRQYGVVIGNLVAPFVFLLVASAGFSDAFGRALGVPYDTYVTFAEYLTPGLACLVLFLATSRSMLALRWRPGCRRHAAHNGVAGAGLASGTGQARRRYPDWRQFRRRC